MRITAFAILALASVSASADALTANSTVSEFALQCQHPALKSNPDQRIALCVDQVKQARERVASKKGTYECWKQLDSLSFLPIFDAMFYLAISTKDAKNPSGSALEEVFVISAPSCN